MDRLKRRKPPEIDPDQLDFTGLDAVVGLVASRLFDRIAPRLDVPYLHVTDATPAFLRETYGWAIPAEADAIEARVIAQAASTVYSSNEIAMRAARDFDTHTAVAPFGINFDVLPGDYIEKPSLERLNLLFVGTDWNRKGGEIAVDALHQLRASGVDAHLTVIGGLPAKHAGHRAITDAGFLNKNKPRQAAKLTRFYAQAHFLLLPTRADCAPMVIAEAMAHATPVIASRTGGVATLLDKGNAGHILPLEASGRDWAKTLRQTISDADQYRALSRAAFNQAHGQLTWGAWSNQILRLLKAHINAITPLHTLESIA